MNMLEELGSIVLNTHSLGRFTDDEFYQFCLDNRDLKFERDPQNNIIVMSNTGGKTGNYNIEISAELALWNRVSRGGICFDSSTAFKLQNGAVRSPDAAWIKVDRWNSLSDKEREQFPPLCPDFIIEIKSLSDVLITQKNKMAEWVANGSRLAWLIDPKEKITYVFYAGQVKIIPFGDVLIGESVLEGFEITLGSVFN
jgi:Uma2 family endonuclease